MKVLSLVHRPLYQAIALLVATLLALLIVRPKENDAAWTLAGVFYIIFILLNSIVLVWQDRPWPYFFYSLLFSVVYILAAGFLMSAYSNSGRGSGSGESSMIFLVIIYHPFTLLLGMLAKWIWRSFFG